MKPNTTHVEVANIDGTSNLVELRNKQPIKILAPKTHNSVCHLVATNYGGGLVQGDKISMDIRLGSGTKTLLSSQANARVYKAEQGKKCVSSAETLLKGTALFVQLNDPLVLQAKSNLEQTTVFTIDGESVLVFLDWVAAGRIHHGELFDFKSYSSYTKIVMDGVPIAIDNFVINPSETDCLSPAVFNDHTTFVNLFIAGCEDCSTVELLETAVHRLTNKWDPKFLEQGPEVVLSGDRINEKLFILRVSAKEVSLLKDIVEELCEVFAETELLGFNPYSRKY